MNQDLPYLPCGREIKYVDESDPYLSEAKRLCLTESTDRQHPTGSVVVKDGEIIGRASNQSALKSECLIKFHKAKFCVRRFLKIPSGSKYWMCPGCAAPRHHSEQRAVKDAIKHGFSTDGADLYLYGHFWCCKPCWDKMIMAGIKDVYLLNGARAKFEAKR